MPILQTDEGLEKILKESKNVAVVGISPNPLKPSYFVSEVVKSYGFNMFFVNPKYAGEEILGEKVYASLEEIPEEIDIVNVFRRPADIKYTAEEAKKKGFKTFWFQPGTVNDKVVKQLDKVGYNVVVDRCMKVELKKLLKMEGKMINFTKFFAITMFFLILLSVGSMYMSILNNEGVIRPQAVIFYTIILFGYSFTLFYVWNREKQVEISQLELEKKLVLEELENYKSKLEEIKKEFDKYKKKIEES